MEFLDDYCVNKLLCGRFVMNPADCCVKNFIHVTLPIVAIFDERLVLLIAIVMTRNVC